MKKKTKKKQRKHLFGKKLVSWSKLKHGQNVGNNGIICEKCWLVDKYGHFRKINC